MTPALAHVATDAVSDFDFRFDDIRFEGDARQASGLDLPIVAINLLHCGDRWQALVERLSAKGLDKVCKFPAVDGRKIPTAAIQRFLRSADDLCDVPQSHFTLTRPAVGCFLSHIGVWRWVVQTGLPRVLILEDDANPTVDHTTNRFQRLIEAIPEDAEHVFLGSIIMNGLAEAPAGAQLQRMYYFNGTFAYMVTPRACRRLLEAMLPMRAHVGHQMSQFLVDRRNDYQANYCSPAMFEPDWSLRSDCYVPIFDESPADRELGNLLSKTRSTLLAEGRKLLPAFS